MADVKELKKKDADELIEEAKKTHDIEDLEERVGEIHAIWTAYQEAPKVGFDYIKKAHKIDSAAIDDLAENLHELYEERADEGKKLTYPQQMDFFKKLANIIAPPMGMGNKDTPEDNWTNLQHYLKHIKSSQKDGGGGDKRSLMDDVRDLIKNGDLKGANQLIVNAIIQTKKDLDAENFLYTLIDPDDFNLHVELAGPLTDYLNDELQRSGINDKEYKPEIIAQNIYRAFKERTQLAKTHQAGYLAVSKKDNNKDNNS